MAETAMQTWADLWPMSYWLPVKYGLSITRRKGTDIVCVTLYDPDGQPVAVEHRDGTTEGMVADCINHARVATGLEPMEE